jgi:flagellar motility protein MotE (MotC chaperone)
VAKRLTAVRKATDRSNAAGAAVDGPSSPPLDIGALRAEVHRESHRPTELDATELPETKVEKMLAEVAKAREALHADTLKLEALVAAAALKPAPAPNPDDEGADDAGKSPRAEGEAGAAAGGKAATKNPQDILAKALRGIKPEQAAPIVTKLDPQLAAAVLQRMPPVDAGKILAAMKADNAAQLATLIAARKPRGDARTSAAPAAAERPAARPPAAAVPAAAPAAGGAPSAEGAPPVATGAEEAGK